MDRTGRIFAILSIFKDLGIEMDNSIGQSTIVFFDSISGHTFTAVEVKDERVSPITIEVDPESVARRRRNRKRPATDVLAEDAHCIVLEAPYLKYKPQHIPDCEKVDKTHAMVFKCEYCPDIFPTITALEIHNVCRACFNTKGKLMQHVSGHVEELPYGCGQCQFACALHSELKE
ncbi:hypothetical protein B566_EDAN008961, partial [Ephemera danica]